jgi:tetratricopeptide (TPR) repeat protein
MNDAHTYTEQEAQMHFAKSLNGEVWQLLEKPDRSSADSERMLHAAHASCFHWLNVGAELHHQRGEWLIARVYTVLGLTEPALRHAARCLELTKQFPDQMEDFDRAFAYEGVARANALAGNRDEALKYIRLADEAGRTISDAEDKSIFVADFNGGNWHGVK